MGIYLGFGEERPYHCESSPELLADRIRHNLTYFYLNYGVLTVSLFALSVVTNPVTVFWLAIVAAMWVYVVRTTESGMTESGDVVVAGACLSVIVYFFVTFVCLISTKTGGIVLSQRQISVFMTIF